VLPGKEASLSVYRQVDAIAGRGVYRH
jgi:hypothetical protein